METANVKPLTENRGLPFVVRLPNLDPNVFIDELRLLRG